MLFAGIVTLVSKRKGDMTQFSYTPEAWAALSQTQSSNPFDQSDVLLIFGLVFMGLVLFVIIGINVLAWESDPEGARKAMRRDAISLIKEFGTKVLQSYLGKLFFGCIAAVVWVIHTGLGSGPELAVFHDKRDAFVNIGVEVISFLTILFAFSVAFHFLSYLLAPFFGKEQSGGTEKSEGNDSGDGAAGQSPRARLAPFSPTPCFSQLEDRARLEVEYVKRRILNVLDGVGPRGIPFRPATTINWWYKFLRATTDGHWVLSGDKSEDKREIGVALDELETEGKIEIVKSGRSKNPRYKLR